jgi:hypothetical protein
MSTSVSDQLARNAISPAARKTAIRKAVATKRKRAAARRRASIVQLAERVEALEAIIFHHRQRPALADRKLSKPDVALREGVSPRSVERRVQAKLLPPPDEIGPGGRWYWWLTTLKKHDRARRRKTDVRAGAE